MREVWTLNLEGVPDGAAAEQADAVVSACAWSDDGLLAYASSAARPAAKAALCGYTSTPSIYVLHVDHPERHSQLSGGHEHDISHLSWVHRQMGTVLMSADVRTYICLWKPVQVPRLSARADPMQPRACKITGPGGSKARAAGRGKVRFGAGDVQVVLIVACLACSRRGSSTDGSFTTGCSSVPSRSRNL